MTAQQNEERKTRVRNEQEPAAFTHQLGGWWDGRRRLPDCFFLFPAPAPCIIPSHLVPLSLPSLLVVTSRYSSSFTRAESLLSPSLRPLRKEQQQRGSQRMKNRTAHHDPGRGEIAKKETSLSPHMHTCLHHILPLSPLCIQQRKFIFLTFSLFQRHSNREYVRGRGWTGMR